jgi:hypothetical protein
VCGFRRPKDSLQQHDFVGRELGRVRSADMTMLVIAHQGVHSSGMGCRERSIREDDLSGGIAIILAKEFRPLLFLEVRAVNQIPGEQDVNVTMILTSTLEDFRDPVEVSEAPLQIRADDEPTAIGKPQHLRHRFSRYQYGTAKRTGDGCKRSRLAPADRAYSPSSSCASGSGGRTMSRSTVAIRAWMTSHTGVKAAF